MNVTDIIKQFVQALLIYLLQVLVFRTTALWDVAACFIYVGFIIQLPFYLPRLSLLAITFVYTFAIDIFFNTPGVHTSAALLIMYIRPSVVKLLSPQGGYDSFESVNIFNMGIQWHAMYALILIFIHTSVVFLIESLGTAHFGVTFLKIISTTMLTLIAVIMYQFLFLYKRNSR